MLLVRNHAQLGVERFRAYRGPAAVALPAAAEVCGLVLTRRGVAFRLCRFPGRSYGFLYDGFDLKTFYWWEVTVIVGTKVLWLRTPATPTTTTDSQPPASRVPDSRTHAGRSAWSPFLCSCGTRCSKRSPPAAS